MNAIPVDVFRIFMRSALPLIALAALLTASRGIAAAADTSDCEMRAIRSQEVLVGARLENWEPVNDRMVLIWSGHEARAHLIRLDRPLSGLAAAPIIDLVDGDHDRSISPCGHDGIRIGKLQGDGTVARIVSIEYLSYRRTMELDPEAQAPSIATLDAGLSVARESKLTVRLASSMDSQQPPDWWKRSAPCAATSSRTSSRRAGWR